MKPYLCALLPLALLAGCTSSRFEADVTRFHIVQQGQRGAVFLQPLDTARAGTLEFQNYAGVLAAELRDAGFTIAPTREAAEVVGLVGYGQATREGMPGRSPVTIGVGGGTGGGNVGIGIGTTFGVGKPKSSQVAINTLSLKLERASDNSVLWEGRAVSEASDSGRYGSLSAAMPALASALLRDFPGVSGQTVTVKSPN